MRRLPMLLVLIVCIGLAGSPARSSARGYWRWAYYVPDDPRSYRSLEANHNDLDIVAPDAWRIRPDGSITSRIQPEVVARMREWGLKVIPMVSKWSWNDTMHGFFASPTARSRAAQSLIALVLEGQYDGIQVDIENIEARDAAAFEAFVAEIAAGVRGKGPALSVPGKGRFVTIALPARTARYSSHVAFNYARLGALCDLVVVMAYDHGWAGGKPSPVAPLPWVREVVDYAVSQMPRTKVLLGIPWYGYDWNTSTQRLARYVGFDEVVAFGGEPGYDQQAEAPTLQYIASGQRHTVWYENAQSVRPKLNIMVEQELIGWAAWRLGYDDPAIWELIEARR